jgi:hypothetical protein
VATKKQVKVGVERQDGWHYVGDLLVFDLDELGDPLVGLALEEAIEKAKDDAQISQQDQIVVRVVAVARYVESVEVER